MRRLCMRSGFRRPAVLRTCWTHDNLLLAPLRQRRLHLPPFLAPPAILTGLFLTLWIWKCTMLVIFQNAIIYNPFLPPNSRSLRIDDFVRQCGGVAWREERMKSMDGTEIALCISEMATGKPSRSSVPSEAYILYFQGNASSLPPRLPDISGVLRRLQVVENPTLFTVVCLSYRGYWKSQDRPSEKGINKDAQALLQWVSHKHREKSFLGQVADPVVLLWGQSIGCGFATNLAASPYHCSVLPISGLILETPFTNMRAMLEALYPQKWLPYRYLWPFLRTQLDSWKNLGLMARHQQERLPQIYIIEAAKDELVPQDHGDILFQRCLDLRLAVERRRIRGALHNDVSMRQEGKQAIAHCILSAVDRARHQDLALSGNT